VQGDNYLDSVMTVKTVFRFPNGNVAVLDEHGQQISELQGKFEDVKQKVEAAADGQTEWNGWDDPETPSSILAGAIKVLAELQRLRRFRHKLFVIHCWDDKEELSNQVMKIMDDLETEEMELETDG
jgi:hypothetical protein